MSESAIVCILIICFSPQLEVSLSPVVSFVQFYDQSVNSEIHQLSWQEGLNYITAVTADSVSYCLF